MSEFFLLLWVQTSLIYTHETIDRAVTWKFLWMNSCINTLLLYKLCLLHVFVRLLCFNWEIDLNKNENICSNNLIISFYRGNCQISRNNKKLTSTNVNELHRISQNLLFFISSVAQIRVNFKKCRIDLNSWRMCGVACDDLDWHKTHRL